MTSTTLSIITGASRGMGHAIARQLHEAGHRVLALSRTRAPDLPEAITQWNADLADPVPVADRLEQWLAAQDAASIGALNFIQNAAVVNAPGPITEVPMTELSASIRINLEAPLLLSAAFLRASAGWTMPRRMLLISSGLGRRGMAGSAMYCAAKAGMDNLARALALEEAERGPGAKVVSLAPGVIDTGMQVQLRGADPSRFSAQAMFAGLKANGQLDSPDSAAAKVIRYLARADFGANPVADVRDA